MKTINLTEKDYQSLLMLLGYAMGAHAKEDNPVPQGFKEVVDWILIQGSPNNYTYYHDKNRLAEQKEAELKEEK